MEAINPNESFVSSLYAKPHPKCMYNTVRTHTFPPALICAEVTWQSSHSRAYWSIGRSVGSLEWHKQTVTYWQPLHTAEIIFDAAVSWPHTGEKNIQHHYFIILCVCVCVCVCVCLCLTDCLHSIQYYQSDLPGLTASSPVFTNVARNCRCVVSPAATYSTAGRLRSASYKQQDRTAVWRH